MKHRITFLLLTAAAGFLTLAFFSVIQRMILGLGFMTSPKAYIVPFFYGGTIGLLLGMRQLRIRKKDSELRENLAALQRQSNELSTTKETLLYQIEEYRLTHERLLESEHNLLEKNDELLATEEMLREQIEENEESQRSLQESNRSLQTLFDVSPLSMLISSYPQDVILEVNRKFCDEFGYAEGDVIGRTSTQTGIWGEGGSLRSFPDLLGDFSEISGLEATLSTRKGAVREVLISSKIMDYRGRPCLLNVCLDVTEQKKMEEALRQNQKMEVIGRLAGGVAHDFNNMLAAIIGSADLLSLQLRDNQKAMSFVSTILEAATRSADLTQQLLAFSRKGKKELAPLCMNEAIRAAMTMLERTIDKSITLKSDLSARKSIVSGDTTLLKNTILNLGINARDAMPEGGTVAIATANVQIDAEFIDAYGYHVTPGDYILVSLSDTGVGMKREVVERIFEPFFTTKEPGKGTGLGLAAVYGTVKEHHGCVSVESEPGIGTTFKLYIPLSERRRAAIEKQESVVTEGSGGILLVDDEALIRNSGRQMLEDLGYQVFLAQDGEQALEVYDREKEAITLVILDMVMPKLGGEKTLLQLRSRFPQARVLLSSGLEWGGTKGDLQRYGAQGFIQKPYRRPELCRAIAAALGIPAAPGEA